jgi:probable addiction module antidote protein
MKTVFIGGSRHVSRLPAEVKERLENVISNGHHVIVGDANGADKAVQKYLHDAAYDKVTVFCSGDSYRNNLGQWETRHIQTAKNLKGFQFYAAKDREMAREANFGLMIWDGKSPGTLLNVLRLVRAVKIAVLFSVPEKQAFNFKTSADWDNFLSRCSNELLSDLRERAMPEEWMPSQASLPQQTSFLDTQEPVLGPSSTPVLATKSDDELVAEINAALTACEPASVLDALGSLAKTHGMSQVAKDAGLARESLYRSLNLGDNPEFATVLKVMASLGLHLTVSKTQPPLSET